MNHINKISSLKEMSSVQVAINLCQDNGFKEIALLLEKPTYGVFVAPMVRYMGLLDPNDHLTMFVSDPKKLSIWNNLMKNNELLEAFARSECYAAKIMLWDEAIKKQSQRLTEKLPWSLRQGLHFWMNHIALEYLSFSRRIEVLFGVSRYFLMSVLTREDWTKGIRLDEEKLVLRFLQDERLTVLQRYRISCVYCLQIHISQLWMRLTQEEKEATSWKYGRCFSEETNDLVLLWSHHMFREQEETVECQTSHPWTHAVRKATFYGNRTAVMLCWERLKEHIPQLIILDLALISLQKWQSTRSRSQNLEAVYSYKEMLLSSRMQTHSNAVENFNLPLYYSELMCFFLSQMDEEHQLRFFREAFHSGYTDNIMKCYLDWPHYDDFLPTINRLWHVIPKEKYGECLLTLVHKYSRTSEKQNCYYDYRSLLEMLWEITPEEYKQYVFIDYEFIDFFKINIGRELLSRLSEKYPFQVKDEVLFKCFLYDQPQLEKRAMMQSRAGEYICLQLIQKEKWSFLNWLLEACLLKEEIPGFKKQLIHSIPCFNFCFEEFKQNREKLVVGVIDWSLDLASEKEQFKWTLISQLDYSNTWENLLCVGKFDEVERIINFLSSSDEKKKLYRWHFASCTCRLLIKKCAMKQIDLIFDWCLDKGVEINNVKKHILEYRGLSPF